MIITIIIAGLLLVAALAWALPERPSRALADQQYRRVEGL
jgi:hypothetical protein